MKLYEIYFSKDEITLDKFDLKFFRTIKDNINIGYYPKKENTFFYTVLVDGEKAGVIGYFLGKYNSMHLQIGIHEKFRGKNLVGKFINLLVKEHPEIKRLYATVFDFNKASYKSLIKAGFKELPKKEIDKLKKIGRLDPKAIRLYKKF